MPEVKEMIIEVKKYKYASLKNFKFGDILVIRHANEEEKKSYLRAKDEKEKGKRKK